MKRFLVSLSVAAMAFSAATPAFARVVPWSPVRGDRSNNVTNVKSVRKGLEDVQVSRITRRKLLLRTRSRWTPQSESSSSSAASSSSSSSSAQ